jgi:lipoprotein-anchoring transpeptidase ErfK/SrfK
MRRSCTPTRASIRGSREGTRVILPTQHILPDTPREGLVLNLPEMRLYYYPKPSTGKPRTVVTFPVSIGRMDWATPLGLTRVTAKVINPVWYPPASIRAEHEQEGQALPPEVAAGPDNPLGQYALQLGRPGYLIHGTDRPYGIGMRATHGCIRLYPEDIQRLFEEVPVGTPVRIVNQPYKAGWYRGVLYLRPTRRSKKTWRSRRTTSRPRCAQWSRPRADTPHAWIGTASSARPLDCTASRWRSRSDYF